MKYLLTLAISFIIIVQTEAATVDTVSIPSRAMNKTLKCVVIKPANYKRSKILFPVVYLLHGYDGWYANWIIREPRLKEYSDKYQVLIVCPEGHKSSWYFDSPLDPNMRFETYISVEVTDFIDRRYRTIRDRRGRAITGLSMGGHGALFLAFRHPKIYGACGSMSGLADLRLTGQKYELEKRIGDTLNYKENWNNLSVINAIEFYPRDSLSIIIDCGISDSFFSSNRQLHEKMLRLNIPHDYTERPGKHEWAYWKNSIQYHLLFFSNYFDK